MASLDDRVVCVWPNKDWCFGDELEEYGYDKSDDYIIINHPPEVTDMERYINELTY